MLCLYKLCVINFVYCSVVSKLELISEGQFVQVEHHGHAHKSNTCCFWCPGLSYIGHGPHSMGREWARQRRAQEGSQQCTCRLEHESEWVRQRLQWQPERWVTRMQARRAECACSDRDQERLEILLLLIPGCFLSETTNYVSSSLINVFKVVVCSRTLSHFHHFRKPAS